MLTRLDMTNPVGRSLRDRVQDQLWHQVSRRVGDRVQYQLWDYLGIPVRIHIEGQLLAPAYQLLLREYL